MREIKFRAWDIKENKWASKMFNLGDAGGFNGQYSNSNASYIGMVDNDVDVDRIRDGEYIIEQYTGLHDKSFKDIYEGDIIRIHHVRLVTDGPIHKPRIASVEWVEDETGFRLVGPDVKSTNPWLYPYSHLEIIGNIHENQELLK